MQQILNQLLQNNADDELIKNLKLNSNFAISLNKNNSFNKIIFTNQLKNKFTVKSCNNYVRR